MKIVIDARNALHHDAPHSDTMSKATAMKPKSIRLSDDQLAGLNKVAAEITKKTKMECDACAVIRFAVDDYLENLRKRKGAKK